jgi:hypothetical protein
MARHFQKQGTLIADLEAQIAAVGNALDGDLVFKLTPSAVSNNEVDGTWTRDVVITLEHTEGGIHTWYNGTITTGVAIADTSAAGTASIPSTTLVFVKGVCTVTVSGDDALWSKGIKQAETTVCVNAPTSDGNITATVTAAGMTNSPLDVVVAILDADTNVQVMAKIEAAFLLESDITDFFTLARQTNNMVLEAKLPAANDATMEIAYVDTGSTGATFDPSGNTTAGTIQETDTLTVAEATIAGATVVTKTSVETFV